MDEYFLRYLLQVPIITLHNNFAFDISTRSLANSETLPADVVFSGADSNSAQVTGLAFNDTGTSMYVLIQDLSLNNDTIFLLLKCIS